MPEPSDHDDRATQWRDCQDEEVQTAFEFTLKDLSVTEDWFTSRRAEELTGRHGGLGLIEIRFGVFRQQAGSRRAKARYRPVGFIRRYPGRDNNGVLVPGEFVLILSCEKISRGTYDPANAFDAAVDLKRQHDKRRGTVDDHTI